MFYIYAALYQVVLKDTLNSLRNVKHDGDSLVGDSIIIFIYQSSN